MTRSERVLVVGAGGLGCAASLALAQAGIRRVTLVDPDRVDVSNLHRQLWHRVSDVGALKVESAARGLCAAFPGMDLALRSERLDPDNVLELFAQHDWVVDGTDGVETKFLLSDAAVSTGVALAYAGVVKLHGQAMRIEPQGPCLRCLFEEPPNREGAPTCSAAGVMGSMVGVMGALQAMLLLGDRCDDGRAALHVVEGAALSSRVRWVSRAADCMACGVNGDPARLLRSYAREEGRCTL